MNEFEQHRSMVKDRARALMERDGVEALVALTAEDFYYITGFPSYFLYSRRTTGAAFAVFFRDPTRKTIAVMNEFEALAVDPPKDCALRTFPIWMDIDDPLNLRGSRFTGKRPIDFELDKLFAMLAEILCEADIANQKIGMEISTIQHFAWNSLKENLPEAHIFDSQPMFLEMRRIKSEWELNYLRQAVAITEKGIRDTVENFKQGESAADLCARFKASILSDPRSSLPKLNIISVGTDIAPRRFFDTVPAAPGRLVKFDVGTDVHGYGADIARTFCVGKPGDLARRTYDALKKGHDRLMELAGPGVSMKEMFFEVMEVIHAGGLPSYNRGHLGHSTGLTIEERPFVGPNETCVLEPGMCICLETPYYGIGVGAIMIENQMIITENGIECLNQMPRELVEL